MKTEEYVNKHSSSLSIILVLLGFIMLLFNDFLNNTFWYDEAYTIAMMKYSFSDIWQITATDVHPPLYYFMLKTFALVFGYSTFTLRLFSNLGVMACLVLGLFPIKRLFGAKTSLLFILLMVLMPVNQYLGVEIRMYSWAMFFVLACAVYAYEISVNTTLVNYAKATFFAICAAYTHYYALVAVGVIFVILLTTLLIRRKMVVRLLLFSSIFFILYSPWIPTFSEQLQSVRTNFWVETPTPKDMLLFCYYFFSPKEPSHPYMIFSLPVMSVALSIMLLIIAIVAASIVKQHLQKGGKKLFIADAFILVFLLTITITFTITFTIKPISVPRYTSCMLGVLILGVSLYLVELYNTRKMGLLVTVGIALLGVFGIARFFSEKAYYEMKNSERTQLEFFVEKEQGDIEYLVANEASYPALAELSVILPHKRVLLISTNENRDYRPFNIEVRDSIPHCNKFYYVQTNTDSIGLNSKYKTLNKLEFEKLSISLKTQSYLRSK